MERGKKGGTLTNEYPRHVGSLGSGKKEKEILLTRKEENLNTRQKEEKREGNDQIECSGA